MLRIVAVVMLLALSGVCCSGGSSEPSDSAPTDIPSLMKSALLNPSQLGNDWELIPPLKHEDTILVVTCTVGGKVQQETIDTTSAAGEHLAGRRTPLMRPQFEETIAVLPSAGVADYMTRERNCNPQNVSDFTSYGDETVFRHVSRSEPNYVDGSEVVVRRGRAVLKLSYDTYQSDLYDPGRFKSIVALADKQFARIAKQLQ